MIKGLLCKGRGRKRNPKARRPRISPSHLPYITRLPGFEAGLAFEI
jgi:hypothetical protein